MRAIGALLVVFTALIFWISYEAAAGHGVNWPAVFVPDLLALNWRSQFNGDLLMHLILLAIWVAWREGFGIKGVVFGIFTVAWGGMFSFPYLLVRGYQSGGDARTFFLGARTRG